MGPEWLGVAVFLVAAAALVATILVLLLPPREGP